MNKVVKVLGLGLVLGVSLMSCEKPSLEDEMMSIEVKGWSSDIFQSETKSGRSLTGKSTSDVPAEFDNDKVEITIYGEHDQIDTTPEGIKVYEALVVEGDISLLGSEPTESQTQNLEITGSVVYMIQTINHPELGKVEVMNYSINYADGSTPYHSLPTMNYEFIIK